ncbi:glucose dehydrogenase [FAD, quinone]-like [Cydia splendana]|uniref:glucose dehydrogenase [FAD, quinone]-like n=1 Tax=Cydia splendana TaxID=1100963 RepID=UPI00300D52AD
MLLLLGTLALLGSLITSKCQQDMLIRSQGVFQFKDPSNSTSQTRPRGAMMDLAMRALSPVRRPTTTSIDFFGFLRDAYPLPGGQADAWAEYDYVVVGAGSAGSAVASRLTEQRDVTVLVLEAGRAENILTDVPALAPYFQRTEYAWQYRTEPQPGVCLGMEGRRCLWPRGRAVGGTSVINYMLYTRGRPEDWDRIAQDGNYGWSYEDVLPYFMKLEKSNLMENNENPYKGHSGKVSIENPPLRTRLIQAFLAAGRLLGDKTIDYNDPDKVGLGYAQTTTSKGHRHSAAKAYLHPHKNRKNLHILPETRATKVVIDKATKTATGVEYVRNGMRYMVKARREVILSAGPIESPKLLMLSGIGPENHLKKFNITVLQNLSVGRTLYDHISFDGIVFTLNTSNISLIESREANLPNIIRWINYGDGPLASPGGVEGLGYIKTDVPHEDDVYVDLELLDIGGSIGSDGGGAIRQGMRIRDDVFNPAYGPIVNRETWSAFPMLLYPKSRGYLELRDKNPLSPPKIVNNYLTHPRDVATLLAGIRYVIKMGNLPPFKKYGSTLFQPNFPECRNRTFNTDDFWECGLRQLTQTEHHQIATCKMGPVSDPDAVVDNELKVYGIERLRVIDSSIIPRHTAAHTNGPAMMIGEKGADLLQQAWKWKTENYQQSVSQNKDNEFYIYDSS